NVKDGISLVKTAEGAMQEVQDMLKRMKYLATQSANGTYQNDVDRENLQKEVDSLKTEINRIADSANFNGIKLLNGELDGSGASGGASGVDTAIAIEGGNKNGLAAGTTKAQETTATFSTATGAVSVGDTITISLEMTDGTKYSFDLEAAASGALKYKGDNLTATYTAAGMTAAEQSAALAELLNADEEFAAKFTADGSAAAFKITSNEATFGDPSIKVASVSLNGASPTNVAGSVTTANVGKGKHQTFNVAQAQVYDASSATQNMEDSIYTVNGQKFAFAKDAASAKALGSDVNVVIASATTPAATDAAAMVALMNQKLGANIATPTGTTIEMISKAGGSTVSGSGAGLTLQIGDTADTYNQMSVVIGDMHTTGKMGIDSIDISTLEGAQKAIGMVTDATNYVSSIRGDLGAIQNRLDHTLNNLSVMAENIQDAESTIRDTDVADEMMSYVNNNILIQSAQAMLAQANQVPQGVLQLLG
ncbi:MAG: flagellin, partial [Oscillibacter sp.]|nr:flagellin [Oscillibacter sp.]